MSRARKILCILGFHALEKPDGDTVWRCRHCEWAWPWDIFSGQGDV